MHIPSLKLVNSTYVPVKPGIYISAVREEDQQLLSTRITVTKIRELLAGHSMWIGPTISIKGSSEIHTYIDASSFFNEVTSEIIQVKFQVYFSAKIFDFSLHRELDFRTFIVAYNILKIIKDKQISTISYNTPEAIANSSLLDKELHNLTKVFPKYKFWVNLVDRYYIHIVPMFNHETYIELVFNNRQEIIDWLDLSTNQFNFK